MQRLAKEILKNQHRYELVERTFHKAIYAMYDGDKLIGSEIFKIKVYEEGELYGKMYPKREAFPGKEDFGKTAWCSWGSIESAMEAYHNLEIKIKKLDE